MYCHSTISAYYFLRCLDAVAAVTVDNEDQKKGVEILKYALTRPLYQIADNAGLDASVIVNQVKNASSTEGFDAASEKMTDMIASGIIDPAKVVRTALTDASGVASLLCTAEVSKYKYSTQILFSNVNILLLSASSPRSLRRILQCPAVAWEAWAAWVVWEAWAE